MKKIFTIMAAVLITASVFLPQNASAQAPGKMSYQAVIRDAIDNLVTNQAVGMQISILQGSATGSPVYVETQNPNTNANGLVSLEIDNGTVASGDLTTIDYLLRWLNTPGDMSYWNGSAWVVVAATPNEGATLKMISGVPTWIGSPPAIGDFRDGGVVFWLDGSGGGLVCAVSDQSAGIQWYNGTYTTTGATGTAIGTGQANTTAIVANQGAGSYAAQLSNDLVLNGYSDWFLPSLGELDEMYLNKAAIDTTATAKGGVAFASGLYWSSTDWDLNLAWVQHFLYGYQDAPNKTTTYYVRSVRAF